MRSRSSHLAVAGVLAVLLAVVATLQYRWVDDVGRAERERLHSSLRARAADFGSAADRDVSQAYSVFQLSAAAFDADPIGTLAAAADKAAHDTLTGRATRAVFVAEPRTDTLQQWDARSRTLQPVPWPGELAPVAERLKHTPLLAVPELPLPGLIGAAIDASVPALVVPMTSLTTLAEPAPGQALVVRSLPVDPHPRTVVVWLDRERLRAGLLDPLVQRTFGDPETSDFDVSVVERSTGRTVSAGRSGPVDAARADLSLDFLTLRLDDLHWSRGRSSDVTGPPARTDRVSITIVRQGGSDAGGSPSRGGPSGAWTLLVRAKQGSLDAVVARSRIRNLALSLGVLGVLGASMVLLLASSARAQRTARQQLEFVASVSHELRTPLAVIRSAAENLADGVVTGPQVTSYGALIRDEGRRLTEMVERVMDFAGLSSGAPLGPRQRTGASAAVDAVVSALQPEASARGVRITTLHADDLPDVMVDPSALTSALQNVIGNAVKYSGGEDVEVSTGCDASTVFIAVRDRGLGIDDEDLPHVFEPFYRGRRAVESQVRGSGVGLSVVKQIVEAHAGRVSITQRPGGGTEVVIVLPANPHEDVA